MPTITDRKFFDGAEQRIARLGLTAIWQELGIVLTDYPLRVREEKHANGAAAIAALVDERFEARGGWQRKRSGGVDWTKCLVHNGAKVCLGVEIQVSARSDLAIVDVVHLRDSLIAGEIDVGVIVAPSDRLSPFLTDRVARYSDAVEAVARARAEDLPLVVVGFLHDGAGPALKKRVTRK
jgi:hypothetical protein